VSVGAALIIGALAVAGCGSSHPLRGANPSSTPSTTSTVPTSPSSAPPVTAPEATPSTPSTALKPMTSTGPAAALFRTALADADAEHWVHGVSRTAAGGADNVATTSVSDDGPDQGTQEITIGSVAGDIRVIGTTTFIRGGSEALADLFDVPTSIAAGLGATWLILRPGNSEYDSVTEGVTISSFLQETAFSGTVTEASTKLGRTPATVLSGALASAIGVGSGDLYVTRGPRPLPLEWKVVQAGGTTITTFSDWGHTATVTAPAGAVAIPLSPGGIITVSLTRRV
jgi:hypothetical protein